MLIRVGLVGMAIAFIASGDAFAQQRTPTADSAAPSLRSFGSNAELESYLRRIESLALDAQAREDSGWGALCGSKFNLTRRSTSPSRSFSTSADVVIRVSVSDTAGKTVSGALLNIDESGMQTTTRENGEAILVVPAAKIPESHRLSLTVRGPSHNYRRGHFNAIPGDTIDVKISICENHMVLQQTTSSTGGARRVWTDFGPAEQQGVDAGDDAKVFGRFLVILRRGRLFSFDLGLGGPREGTMRLIGFVNLYGATGSAEFRRLYKLMVRGDQIVVAGYEVAARDVEIQLLRIDGDGVVRRTATHQLRVNCAYGRCDARLAGDKLVILASSPLTATTADSPSALLAMRRVLPTSKAEGFRSLVTPRDMFAFPNDSLVGSAPYLNSIAICDVTSPALSCEARVIIGPRKDGFHVSPTTAYVWAHGGDHPNVLRPNEGAVTLFRVPLSDHAPQAVRLNGGPFDRLSLNEDAHATLRLFASGDSHYGPRSLPAGGAREAAALFKLRPTDFGDGTRDAPASAHRTLPLDEGIGVGSEFVGSWLLYTVGGGYFRHASPSTTLFAVRTDSGAPRRIKLPYYVERIAPVDSDAIVIGTAASDTLHFLRIDPSSTSPLGGHFVLANPSRQESEGDGFFHGSIGSDRGLLAIPGRGYGRSDSTHWVSGSTSVVFARASRRGFAEIGSLSITPGTPEQDSLEVQSGWFDDWYGNARGILVEQRIFALIGYELIEARMIGGRLVEQRRINFMPTADR